MNRIAHLPILAIASLLAATRPVTSQTAQPATPKHMTRSENAEHFIFDSVDRTYPLHYANNQLQQNEILTALRNVIDPETKIFLVPSTSIIAVHAPEEIQTRVASLLTALDRPHPRYRLTYTVTEMDGNKKIGVQHFAMVVLAGQRGQMKQGSRLPIFVGSSPASTTGSQYTYIDVGMNFDATLDEVQTGGVLRSKVEQTSIAPDTTSTSNPNPIIRQTQVDATTTLVPGKPLLLGSLDVPSSTRHFDIEVVMEPVN